MRALKTFRDEKYEWIIYHLEETKGDTFFFVRVFRLLKPRRNFIARWINIFIYCMVIENHQNELVQVRLNWKFKLNYHREWVYKIFNSVFLDFFAFSPVSLSSNSLLPRTRCEQINKPKWHEKNSNSISVFS